MTVASFSQRKSGWGKIWLVAIFLMASPLLVEWVQSIHYPISGEHYHRQADTFSVALNFLEHPNFFYPRVHHTYGKTGIHGMEAPIVPYTISLWLRIFGPHEWLGRVNTLLYFLLGLLAFLGYWQQGSPSHSRWLAGSVLFFSPMTLFYSRQIQPDMPMICIGLLGVYLALRSRRKPQRALWLATFVFALGVLTKYPLLFVWPAFVVAAIRWRTTSWRERFVRFTITCVPLFLVGVWMLWASYLERRYALGLPEYFAATPKPSEIWDNIKHFNLSHTVGHILPHYAITVLFFPIFVYGWLCSFQRQYREWAAPLWLWLLGSVLLVLMFTSRLHSHYYYAMLYLPPVWLFTALGLHRIWMWLCLAASPREVSCEETVPESSSQDTYQEVPWVLAVYLVFFLLQTPWDVKHTIAAVVILMYTGCSVLLQRRGESFSRYAKISAVWGISLFLCYTALKASHDRFHERCTRLGNPYSFTERATVLRNLLRDRVVANEPIVMVADYNPWFLHAAARKGWTHYDHVLFGSLGLDDYRQYGVRWLVVNQNITRHTPRVLYPYAPVATAGEWKLYWVASTPSPVQIRPVQPYLVRVPPSLPSSTKVQSSTTHPSKIQSSTTHPSKIQSSTTHPSKIQSSTTHPSKVLSPASRPVLKQQRLPDPLPRIVPLKKRP